MDDTTIIAEVQTMTQEGALLNVAGQQLQWPADSLPAGLQAGDPVVLRLQTKAGADHQQHEQARIILSEILGSDR